MQENIAEDEVRHAPRPEMRHGTRHRRSVIRHIAVRSQIEAIQRNPDPFGLRLQQRRRNAVHRRTPRLIRETYGGRLKVFSTDIPRSIRAAEISAEGVSIFKHDPGGKVADAYRNLTKEVLKNAEKRRKHQLDQLR